MTGSLNILAISESMETLASLTDSLIEANYAVCAAVQSNEDIKSVVQRHQVDAIVVYLKEVKLIFMNQMYELIQQMPKPVIVFTEKSHPDLIEGVVAAGISAFIVDGFAINRIQPIVEIAIARFNGEQSLRDELKRTQSKLSERKVIEKAKGIIMDKRNLKEDDAYKALRKLAMDKNQRIADVAEDLISVAKLL